MAAAVSPRTSVGLAVTLAAVAFGTWWWQNRIFHLRRDDAATSDSWAHVQHDYPMVQGVPDVPALSAEVVEGVVRANPFSSKRWVAPPTAGGGPEHGGAAVEPAKPIFVYKGRIQLGQRQRAIMEETASRKTYFLEVGQEVAGCKVLDISENRVVLSDLQTNKEVVVSLIGSPESR